MKNSAKQITKDETQFKGTKGKWGINHEQRNQRGILIECNNPNWDVCNTTTNYEEDIANALLISKAPEMLEMISELLKELEFHGYRHSTTIYNAQNLIKEATEIK